jgi:hypothetical protein
VEAGVKAVCFLWYPSADLITTGDNTIPQTLIWQCFQNYLNSPFYNQIKFCLSLQAQWVAYPTGGWANIANFAAYFATLVSDPQYLLVDGAPVVWMYEAGVGWDATHANTIRTAMTLNGVAPKFVQSNNSASVATTISAYGICSYGPQGAQPAGSNQIAYAAQMTKDLANFTSPATNAKRVVTATHGFDGRPVAGRGEITWWGDTPMYSQWQQNLNRTVVTACTNSQLCPDGIANGHSGGEWGENGTFFPSTQTAGQGPNNPSRGPIVDAIQNVRFGTFPVSFWEYLHGDSKHVELDGGAPDASWTIAAPITTGAWEFSEFSNSTVAKTRTWLPGSVSGYLYDRLRIYGPVGPTFGSFSVVLNGGAPVVVNQNAVSTLRHQLLYDSGDLTPATTHSLVMTIASAIARVDRYDGRHFRVAA